MAHTGGGSRGRNAEKKSARKQQGRAKAKEAEGGGRQLWTDVGVRKMLRERQWERKA